MLIVVATVATLLSLCRAKPFYGYNVQFPGGGIAAVSNGGKTAVFPLSAQQGRQIKNMMEDHSKRMMKNTQDEIEKSFANSQRFSQNLQAKINADIRRSMANAFGNMGMDFDMDWSMPDFQNNLINNIQSSIANSQQLSNSLTNGINGVLRDAAKQGKVRVVKFSGQGPSSAIVSSGDGGTVMVAQNSQNGGAFAFGG